MAMHWVLGLVLVAMAAGVLLWLWPRKRYAPPPQTDIQLWDAEDHRQRDFWPELRALQEAGKPKAATREDDVPESLSDGGDRLI